MVFFNRGKLDKSHPLSAVFSHPRLKRAKEREDYGSTWKFFKRMAFIRVRVMISFAQESSQSSKELSD